MCVLMNSYCEITLFLSGVVHTDLKPENFIIVKGSIKLCDFGIAESLKRGHTSLLTDIPKGTPIYMSPETLNQWDTGAPGQDVKFKVFINFLFFCVCIRCRCCQIN